MYKLFCRTYQRSFKLASKFMPYRNPRLLEGEGALLQLPAVIQEYGVGNVLIVTDQGIAALGLMQPLLDELKTQQIDYVVYDQTVPNPTIHNIEEALTMYKNNRCQGIVAFGGGSPMDCAKGVRHVLHGQIKRFRK